MKDRVAARPNTYTMVTNADGTVTLTRADEPIVEGSLINKANMFPDTVCDYLGLPYTAEPKDGFLVGATGRVGDIMSSERINFKDKIGTVYKACDGTVIDLTQYPELNAAIEKRPFGRLWKSVQLLGGVLSIDLIHKASNGRLLGNVRFNVSGTYCYWLAYSDDGGTSWTRTQKLTDSFSCVYSSFAECSNGEILSSTSNGKIYASSNNGTSWTLRNDNFHGTVFAFPDGYLYSSYGQYSTDNGATFTYLVNGIGGSMVYICDLNGSRYAFTNVNSNTYINAISNKTTWSTTTITMPSTNLLAAISNGERVVMVFSNSTTLRYYQGGYGYAECKTTTNKKMTYLSGESSTVFYQNGSFILPTLLANGDSASAAYYSTDGVTWVKTPFSLESVVGASDTKVFASRGNTISDQTRYDFPVLDGFYMKVASEGDV